MKAKLTKRQQEALDWGKANYGRKLKHRLSSRYDELPKAYRQFWHNPFGISEWNEHMRILRRIFWQGKI